MIPTKEQYMAEVDAGYISRVVHPENPSVVILNYTQQAVYERHWNDATLACRGLILNEETGEVLALPFEKFFNNGEDPDAVISPGNPEVTVKMDGSLGISYNMDGKVRWATRGLFTSEQAKAAQEIWDRKYASSWTKLGGYLRNTTLLCEIIHPCSHVVVNYDFSDLVLVGVTDRIAGGDYSYEGLRIIAHYLGMPITQRIEGGLSDALAVAKTLTANEEGFVLRWPNGYRLKVKGDKYLEVHRILYGLSTKAKVQAWANGTLDELIRQLPEEFRDEVEDVAVWCNYAAMDIVEDVRSLYRDAPKDNRKDFALWVKANTPKHLCGFMFALLDDRDIATLIKEYIAKNYRDYVEEAPTNADEA